MRCTIASKYYMSVSHIHKPPSLSGRPDEEDKSSVYTKRTVFFPFVELSFPTNNYTFVFDPSSIACI